MNTVYQAKGHEPSTQEPSSKAETPEVNPKELEYQGLRIRSMSTAAYEIWAG